MGQMKQMAGIGSFRANPVSTLCELVRNRFKRNANLAELKGLDAASMEDIGLFEYTREQIVRAC